MIGDTCPHWDHPANKLIAELFDKARGTVLYNRNGQKMPTPIQMIQQLYPGVVHPTQNYETMDFASWAGKYEPDYEKQIEDYILHHPDKPINDGDSFNGFLDRSLGHFSDLLKSAPNNSVVVTHSSVLKAIRLWDEAGRPTNLRLDNNDYVKEETQTGSVERFKSKNGYVYVVRHGQTDDNVKENLRGPDTRLTDKGIQQAIDAGKELSGIQISQLYCSPLDRAIHTTDLIMQQQKAVQPSRTDVNTQNNKGDRWQKGDTTGRESYGALNNEWKAEDFATDYPDPGERIMPMVNRMRELREQGATEVRQTGSTIRYQINPQLQTTQDEQHVIIPGESRTGEKNTSQPTTNNNREIPQTSSSSETRSRNSEAQGQLFQISTNSGAVDIHLNNVLTDFVHKLQGEVRNVSSIVINGKTYNANAVTDILNKIISVVEGKAGKDTLPEEVAHLFVEYLPEGSLLLQQMMQDIVNRPIYNDVLQEYGDNPLYQNADGSVNDDKIAREAIGKMIAKAITGKWENQREKSTWTKFWDKVYKWFQGIVDTLRNKTTETDPYEQVAAEILRGETSGLDMQKYAEAEEKGMYYLELSKEHQKRLDAVKANTVDYTPEQMDTMEFVHERPHREIYQDFTDEKHDYVTLDQDPNDRTHYTPNTSAIYGKKEMSDVPSKKNIAKYGDKAISPKQQGELSRMWGTGVDSIANAIAIGKDWETIDKEIDTPFFTPIVKRAVYEWAKNKIDSEITTDANGKKVLFVPQSIARYQNESNPENSIAASIDGTFILPNGDIKRLIDFKTSIHGVDDDSAKQEWPVGAGSWLPKGTQLSKNEGHGIQLSAEMRMIEYEAADYGKKIRFGTDDPDYLPLATYNLQWVIDSKDPTKITGIMDDGVNPVDVSTYGSMVDKLFHGAPTIEQKAWNPFAEPTTEELKETTATMTAKEAEDYLATINKRLTSLDEILDKMEALTGTRKNTTVSEFGKTTANRFKRLLSDMQELRGKGERVEAVMKYVRNMQAFTKTYADYIADASNFNDPEYYPILQESIKMSNANMDSIPESMRNLLNPDQLQKVNNLRDKIQELIKNNNLFATNYALHTLTKNNEFTGIIKPIVDRKTGAIIKSVEDQIRDSWTPEHDISIVSRESDAIAEMSVPILGQMHILVNKALLQHTLNSNKHMDSIGQMEADFKKSTGLDLSEKKNSDFLFHLDANGERDGMLHERGPQYKDEKERVDNLILHQDGPNKGKKMEPIPNPVTAKDRAFNNKLYYAKKERSAFYKSITVIPGYEETNGDGSISTVAPKVGEGTYHHLSPEYLTEIMKVMNFAPDTKEQFQPKTGVSKNTETVADYKKWYEQNKDNITEKTEVDKWGKYWENRVQKFRDKYQVWRTFDTMEMVLKQDYDEEGNDLGTRSKQPSGKFIKDSGFFPDMRNVLVNDNEMRLNDSTGKMEPVRSLQSKEYLRMKNGTSALEKAQYEYYTKFKEHMIEGAKQGGPECLDWLNRGGLINFSNNFFKKAAEKGLMNAIEHNMAEIFTAMPNGTAKNINERGEPIHKLGVPLMSNVRNIQRIKDIEEKLRNLESKKIADKKAGTSDFVKYDKEKRDLERERKSENHKTDVRDIETNPTKLLSAFRTSTEKYAQFSAIEGKMLALRDILGQEITDEKGNVKQFYETGNLGQEMKKATDKGEEFQFKRKDKVNALKKADDYINLFYGNVMSKTTADVIADRLMNVTSFTAMGFNYINHIKNAILYQASNFRQNIAERFVTRSNYTKAQKEFFASFLPGMQTKLFEKKSGPFKAKSKMEAYVHRYGLDADAQLKAQGTGRGKLKIGDKFSIDYYMGEEFAIHWAQYTMQIGLARDQIMKDGSGKPIKDSNGNNISMYDAHMWDPNTGQLTIHPDVANTAGTEEQMIFNIIQAKDIQTRTQGNFEEMNRPMLKNYLLGRMLSQFHNFFKTAWNDRFDKMYTHASLGEMEGTWRTVGSYIKMMKAFEGHWNEKLKNGWHALSEHQQKNLKTDLWEIGMVTSFIIVGALLRSLGKGIPSSDPNKKKFTNMLAWMMDTIGKEQGTLDPVFGIINIKDLTNNPVALGSVTEEIIGALLATMEAPFQSDENRRYQRGIHAGQLKMMKDWDAIFPIEKQVYRFDNALQESSFNPSFQNSK